MGREDWYHNTVWTEEIKKTFFSRLNRSRSAFNKAQYLRIQALYLQQTGKKENILEAMKLLRMMFADYPEPCEFASAHLQNAECFEELGDYNSALNAYRESINAERKHTGVRVLASLNFGWFVIRRGFTQHYEEVLSLLDINESDLLFPFHQFRFFSVLAIIGDYLGRNEDAQKCAIRALDAINKTESPFRYHKKVGLVEHPDNDIVKKLSRISHNSI